jgi:hypothetical protein
MKVKNRDSGVLIPRAELMLEGRHDVEKLRRVLELYSQHAEDEKGPLVIPIPFPGDSPGRP